MTHALASSSSSVTMSPTACERRRAVSRLHALQQHSVLSGVLHVFGWWTPAELPQPQLDCCGLRSREVLHALSESLALSSALSTVSELVHELAQSPCRPRTPLALLHLEPAAAQVVCRLALEVPSLTLLIATRSSWPDWHELTAGCPRIPLYIPCLDETELTHSLCQQGAPRELIHYLVSGFYHIYRYDWQFQELLHLLWPIYEEKGRDLIYLKPYIAAMQERFSMRAIDADELREMVEKKSQLSLSAGDMQANQLSVDAKRVMVAAFLASYNPANMDQRLFGMAKKRQRKAANRMSKGANKVPQLLLGPRCFEMDRMLAILKRIHPDGFADGSMSSQIATLTSMNLLSFVTSGTRDVLQMGQMKCCIDYHSANRIASSININLNDYLIDSA